MKIFGNLAVEIVRAWLNFTFVSIIEQTAVT